METQRIPWLFALVTAAWFGWMAKRAGRTWILWAVGGGAFGLVISTLVLGLGQASSIPFSEHEGMVDQTEWMTAAVLLIAIVGWLLTSSLHRHYQAISQSFKDGAGASESAFNLNKPAPTPPAKPPSAKP